MASKENQEALEIMGEWNCEKCKHEHGLKCNECNFYNQYCTLQQAIDRLEIVEKALDMACRLAIQNNNYESYISIYKGTRDQYNLPLTQDILMNEKILKNYLLKESEKDNGKTNK